MDDNEDIAETVTAEADAANLTLFDGETVTGLRGIRVFDVGQGDCIGLLDGGLMDHPDEANPNATAERLPVSYEGGFASIVLTHWDKDHYWSANKKNPEAQKGEWLVPRQMASPQAVRFAAELDRAKCWPENRDAPVRLDIGGRWDIEIRKCGKFSKKKLTEDRNKTGLAVTLLEWRAQQVDTYMLLPGDCPFHRIPSLPSAELRGLVAYHHGARKGWTHKTSAAIANFHTKHEMVYSYGENDYGHPDRTSYEPNWNETARTTGEARAAGEKGFDIRWK